MIKSMARISFSLLIIISLANCASVPSTSSNQSSYVIGPASSQSTNIEPNSEITTIFQGFSVAVPPFDPGIPENSELYEEEGIWPELRRTEAVRFAEELSQLLSEQPMISASRVVPSTEFTSQVYVQAKINESNGEDFDIDVKVIDITGRTRMEKNYDRRVGSYDDPRVVSRNKYVPFLQEVAEDINRQLERIRSSQKSEIVEIEKLRFAESFLPEDFSQHLRTNRRGRTSLVSMPADNDPMVERIELMRTRDLFFIDSLQKDYQDFTRDSDDSYLTWQEAAYIESKAAREARAAARAELIGGILITAIGVAIAADSTPYSGGSYAGAAVAIGGAVTALESLESFEDAKAHTESLTELGKSLNIDLAPRVMQLEDREIELQGNASEQYSAWRDYLADFYLIERTPDVDL